MIYNIREYTREDTSAMRSLWSDAFGDPSELIDFFFELLPSMGTGFVAELDGEIFGAAYVLDAFLHLPGGETKKLAYIYAVSVDESAQGRGIGAELTRHACETHGTTRQISAARCRQRMRFMIGTKAAAVLPLQAIADTRRLWPLPKLTAFGVCAPMNTAFCVRICSTDTRTSAFITVICAFRRKYSHPPSAVSSSIKADLSADM